MTHMPDDAPYPFKPRDWVACKGDHSRLAKVRGVARDEKGNVLLDLWLYAADGSRVGRESPACGGPRTYEPSCDAEGWERISPPDFPVRICWVEDEHGRRVARHVAGTVLPPAEWRPSAPRVAAANPPKDDRLRAALEAIAAGHNDPRRLAQEVLGRSD